MTPGWGNIVTVQYLSNQQQLASQALLWLLICVYPIPTRGPGSQGQEGPGRSHQAAREDQVHWQVLYNVFKMYTVHYTVYIINTHHRALLVL